MSFWNKVGQVAKVAGEYAAKEIKNEYEGAKERSSQYSQEMPELSDKQLANIILTEDSGEILGEDDCPCGRKGKYFKIYGRVKNAEIRGCSDTYELKSK